MELELEVIALRHQVAVLHRHQWFGSQPVSFQCINSIPILAADRNSDQMEFSVGTGLLGTG